ncbi:MAG: 3-dehydroquinate synthase [Kiritimatiellae bacterium]|nr:3-dehydroquinate synthase [Kiritimatiellia bacterium]
MEAKAEIFVKTAGGAYPVYVARGALEALGGIAAQCVAGRTVRIVSDSNVAAHYLAGAADSLAAAGFRQSASVIAPGEGSKCFAALQALWADFHGCGLTRRDLVVALGGGVVGDLAGFAAATYLRSVPIVQVPTSLLAFVDSSIGGKTAIDTPFGKNTVGAFHQPLAVVADPLVLATLPPREMAQGMAEALKTACILDGDHFRFMEGFAGRKPTEEELTETIRFSASAKAGVVSRDEREGGLRAILNFGHTVGHAIEKVLGYGTVPHGEAVAVGMVAAAKIGVSLAVTPPDVPARIERTLRALALPVRVAELPGGAGACNAGALAEAMLSDKKKLGAEIHFVLLEEIGRARVVPLAPARIAQLLPAAL